MNDLSADFAAGAALSSSIVRCGADWGELALTEQRWPAPGEVDRPARGSHFICLNLGAPCTLWPEPARHAPKRHQGRGDALLLPAGQPIRGRWDTPADVLHLLISRALVQRTAAEIGTGNASGALRSRFGVPDPRLLHLGLALRAEAETGGAGGTLFVDSLATALAAHLLRHYGDAPMRETLTAGGLSVSEISRVKEYVRGHLDAALSLAEIAAVAGFSPFHFARLFKQATGETLHRFVTRCRVEAAQSLLRRSEMSVGEVAGKVGFAQQSHLARHFRQAVGLSPSAFRRQSLF